MSNMHLCHTALAQMLTLNDLACEIGLAVGATSCTDVSRAGEPPASAW